MHEHQDEPPTPRRLGRCAWLLLAGVGLAGCGAPPPAVPVRHLLADDQPALLSDEVVYERQTVEVWDARAAAGGPWRVAAPATGVHRPGEGLWLQYAAGHAALLYHGPLAAAGVDAVEVTIGYPQRVAAALVWRGAAGRHRLDLALDDGAVGLDRVLTFELRRHPGWQGEVDQLRLELDSLGDTARPVRRVRLLRFAAAGDSVAAAAARSWKVDLDHDVRTAWLGDPSRSLERTVAVPRGGVLHLAYGTTEIPAAPVRFRVRGAVDGSPVTLWQAAMPAADGGRWHPVTIDLAALAGAPATLRLEVETGPGDGLAAGGAVPLWGHPEVASSPASSSAASSPPVAHPNVVLVSVDTLRADHLSLYGYPHPTSPRLDAWARRRATVFETAVAAAPITLPSHTSLFTGLDATRHGVNHGMRPAPPSLALLAERLRAAGYATAAVTGGGWFHPRYGLDQGFDRYRYWPRPAGSDRELAVHAAVARDWLDTLPRPFFLFVHTFDVHDFRLHPGAEAERPPAGDPRSAARWAYDRRIAHVDAALDTLLTRLAAADLERSTLVVITSDHGEGFGEVKPIGHGYLDDNNLLVPLVVAHPGGRGAGRRVRRQVRAVDLVPTVLAVAGVPAADGIDGVSLLPLLDGAAAAALPRVAAAYAPIGGHGLALRLGDRLKYRRNDAAWTPPAARERLYDLRADPGESQPLAEHPDLPALRLLAGRLLAGVAGLRLRFANASPRPLRFTLQSALFDRHAIKADQLTCDCVALRADGTLAVSVPAGARLVLRIEHLYDPRLEVEAATEDAAGRPLRRRWTVDTAALASPLALALTAAGWRDDTAASPPETGVLIAWQGAPQAPAAAPYQQDPELRRALRALGYID